VEYAQTVAAQQKCSKAKERKDCKVRRKMRLTKSCSGKVTFVAARRTEAIMDLMHGQKKAAF